MASKRSVARASSWIQLIASKTPSLPKLTRRSVLALAFFTLIIIGAFKFTELFMDRRDAHPRALQAQPPRTDQPTTPLSTPTVSGNHGPVYLNAGDNRGGTVGPQFNFAPPKFRDRYRVMSDGPDYPILMANRLADSNLIKAPRLITTALAAMATNQGKQLDPASLVGPMLDQIALVWGTEIEVLQADIAREIDETPEEFKPAARLFAGLHTKVRVADGKYKGHTGWVASPLINKDRVLMTEN